jgi:hypothetical protein
MNALYDNTIITLASTPKYTNAGILPIYNPAHDQYQKQGCMEECGKPTLKQTK